MHGAMPHLLDMSSWCGDKLSTGTAFPLCLLHTSLYPEFLPLRERKMFISLMVVLHLYDRTYII